MKKNRKKPRGIIGPVELGPKQVGGGFQPIQFPETKPEIEEYILNCAIRSAEKMGMPLYNLTRKPDQNPENDFDFTLFTTQGTEYLDLMEVMPLAWVNGPHERAPASYNNGEFADAVYVEISKKAEHYKGATNIAIHLLLYPTDWKLRLSSGVQNLLAFFCQRDKLHFKSIATYLPDDQSQGEVTILYPSPSESFVQFDETTARQRVTLVGDFTKVEFDENGSVIVPFAPLVRRKPVK
jgi:hypothetical protein